MLDFNQKMLGKCLRLEIGSWANSNGSINAHRATVNCKIKSFLFPQKFDSAFKNFLQITFACFFEHIPVIKFSWNISGY